MLKPVRPYLILAALGIAFFLPLVERPGEVLYSDHSDLLAFHLPARQFLVREWQATGELPLWCPYSFAGMPFIHDIQVAAFYPPHWPLLWLPEDRIGPAMSWLVVAHVILAGWCMYGYARSQELRPLAAFVAAVGFMFAGKWLLHVLGAGHYNMIPLAWLPLVLLLLETALRRHSFLWAIGAGAVFVLLVVAAYPYVTFYAGLFVAVWTLGPALEQAGYLEGQGERTPRRTLAALAWWLGLGTVTAVAAVAVAAVQLLPALEAAGQATRGAGLGWRDMLPSLLQPLLFLVGPALQQDPGNLAWEDRGGFGLFWLVAAATAPVLGGPRVRWQAGVCLALIVFALNGGLLLSWLPGFGLFRYPSRMFLVAALPVALLAGCTTQALFDRPTLAQLTRCRWVWTRVLAATLVLVGGLAVRQLLEGKSLQPHPYWLFLLAAVPFLFHWWRRGGPGFPHAERAWVLLLVGDLIFLAHDLTTVRPEAAVLQSSRCLAAVTEPPGSSRVLDRDVSDSAGDTPLGAGAPLAYLVPLEPVRGFNPIDVRRYREYLQLVADRDDPLVPFHSLFAFPIIDNFPIRNKPLLDLLGVRYLLQPALGGEPEGDGWRLAGSDAVPAGYNVLKGGLRPLPAYAIFANDRAYPRAFVVPEAAPLPEPSRVLETLKKADFRRMVWLEGADEAAGPGSGEYRPATIQDYRPNRVTVAADGPAPGWLVLADIWYPGWTCTVNGQPIRVYRANYAFRAVRVPKGPCEVVFRFEPASYRWGWWISLVAAVGILMALSLAGVRSLRQLSGKAP